MRRANQLSGTILSLAFGLLIVVPLLAGCGGGTPPPEWDLAVSEPCELKAGEARNFTVVGSIPAGANVEWQVDVGTLSSPMGRSVMFTAPTLEQDTEFQIIAIVTDEKNSVSKVRNCKIIGTPPTPTTPPQPTDTPTPTDTPVPTPTETSTPPPCPLLEIFPQMWGCNAAFEYGGDDVGGVFEATFSRECAHDGPFGLRIHYSNSGATYGGWGVLWSTSPEESGDLSGFSQISFWIKGSQGGELFQIGLRDTNGVEPKLESDNYVVVSTDWQQVIFPFDDLLDIAPDLDLTSIENFNFGFNKDHKAGTFCVDDLALGY